MQNFPLTVKSMIHNFWGNRQLISSLIRHEILGRYKGSILGLLWSFLNPMAMLFVYTIVFSVIFPARWSPQSASKVESGLLIFAGLIIFNIFAECINKAPKLIISNANYVKKIVFPLEILPVVLLGSAIIHGIIGLIIWLMAYSLLIGIPNITVIFTLIILLPYFIFILGLTWILCSFGVYIRDTEQIITMLTTALMFLSPIFYPITVIPENYRFFFQLNPMTYVLEEIRKVLFWGIMPDLFNWLIYFFISTIFAWLSYFWFQKTRKGFADVL
jgi:lipopolysaccharide transport system permease protein